jgi:hypothetical protein
VLELQEPAPAVQRDAAARSDPGRDQTDEDAQQQEGRSEQDQLIAELHGALAQGREGRSAGYIEAAARPTGQSASARAGA